MKDDIIYIKGGRLMDPVSGMDRVTDMLLCGPFITAVGDDIDLDRETGRMAGLGIIPDNASVRVINAEGLTVAPGLMDAHVHFRDPGQTYKEDIFSGAEAAARGGFTTVICMANTIPPVDTPERLKALESREEAACIHVLQAACVTEGMKGKRLTDMAALADAGAVSFTDDGLPILDEKLLESAFCMSAALDIPVSLHEEDPAYIDAPGVNKGKVSEKLHYGGASHLAEDVMVERDCALALRTGATVCIQHISSGDSVDLVRKARAEGADVHAEATPHHFTLTEEAVLISGTNARMNPPLRTEEDRRRIIEGIKDGTIDMIVTDHAPHSREEKERPMEKAPSGIIGLETSLGLGIRSLVEPGHITLMELLRLMSTNPAVFYRMIPGSFKAGAAADIVIFSENETWKVDSFRSKSANSPFIGWELPGKVHFTICAGEIVYDSDNDTCDLI